MERGMSQRLLLVQTTLRQSRRRAVTISLLSAALDDHAIGALVVAGLETLRELAPRRAGMPAAGGTPLTTAHRVIDGIHRDASVVRPLAEPTRAPGLPERDVRVVQVRHLPDHRAALQVNHADFARRQAELGIVPVLGHEGRTRAGRPDELSPLALLHLDVVHQRAEGDVAQGHGIAGLDVGVPARDDLVADREAVRSENVALLAVDVVKEGDARGAVRIVFDRGDAGGDADLVTAPVDDAVALLVTAASKTARDAAVVIAPAGAGLVLEEAARRRDALGELLEIRDRIKATGRARRLEGLDSHDSVSAFRAEEVDRVTLLEGHDGLLPVLHLAVRTPHAPVLAAHDERVDLSDLDLEEGLDGVPNLNLVRAEQNLEHDLVRLLTKQARLLGQHDGSTNDALGFHFAVSFLADTFLAGALAAATGATFAAASGALASPAPSPGFRG